MTSLFVLLGLFAAAGIAPLLARRMGRNAGYPLALAFAAGTAAIASRAPEVVGGEPVVVRAAWLPAIGVDAELRLDGLSLLFALLVLGVGALVLSYCARYLAPDAVPTRLYGLLTLFAASMLGLVLAGDIVLLFVFWELTSVCSFLLIGGRGDHKGAGPATRALLVTGGGGLALLAGLVLAMVTTGTSDLAVMLADPAALQDTAAGTAAAWLIMLAALTKSAQVPFHFWLPDAMVAITPISAYLHAATMVKAGIYLLARFSPAWADLRIWTITLVGVGVTSALVGAVLALRQHDLKALLAYSTISQLGWLVSLIGIGSAAAMAAALLHTFAHALFKASLFMLVGIVDRQSGSRDVRDLSGLWRVMPLTAAATGLAALSMAGVPPMLGFLSKEESFIAFLDSDEGWLGIAAGAVAALAAALTAAYGLRIVMDAFAGRPTQQLHEPPRLFLLPAAIAALAGVGFGLAASWLSPFLGQVVADARRTPGDVDLALWHGFTPALGLSVLALCGGVVLFLARDRVDRAIGRTPVRAPARTVYDRLQRGILALGHRVSAPARRWPGAGHLGLVLAVGLVAGGAVLIAAGVPSGAWPPVRPGTTQAVDWLVAGLLGLAIVGVATAGSRLAAVALLGAVGFVLAIWYLLLGGADVALTQLLVETLTVVVVVLVLRRLPARFPRATRRGPAIGLAVACGLAAGVGTHLLTGRRTGGGVGDELYRIAEPETGGANAVNTILVDFRGIDTLGEIVVLAAVALGAGIALRLRPDPADDAPLLVADPSPLLRTLARPMVPLLLVLAGYLLIRGHDEPGGGFIAGLVAGAAVVLRQFASRGRTRTAVPVLAVGLALALGTGGAALAAGQAFLEPAKAAIPVPWGGPVTVSSSLLFDAGVSLVVVALVLLATRGLGGVRE